MGVLLIAEDDEDIGLILARLGQRAGFTVVPAPDGAAALELAIAHQPDLILTDLGMPRMDGFELTRAVRADATLGGTPIVMLSGHLHPGDRAPMEAGVCAVLLKPCPNDRLTSVLRDIAGVGPHGHDEASSYCPARRPVGAGRRSFRPYTNQVVDVEVRDVRLGGVRLLLRRDDLLCPGLPGNKWRKLKYNLAAAREQDHDTLLTFGGAYSNHLRATAAAGRMFGFRTVGIVRGEEHLPINDTLLTCVRDGMTLAYLDRPAYRRKHEPAVLADLRAAWGRFYLLPEGGSNALAVRGCAELGAAITPAADVVCCPAGTGATLAGIAAGLRPGQRALGFAVLKGGFLDDEVRRLQQEAYGRDSGNWSISHDYHCGGYAKVPPELERFAAEFEGRHGIAIDRIYVAKMLAGIYDLAPTFPPGTTICAIKTG